MHRDDEKWADDVKLHVSSHIPRPNCNSIINDGKMKAKNRKTVNFSLQQENAKTYLTVRSSQHFGLGICARNYTAEKFVFELFAEFSLCISTIKWMFP